MTPTALYIAATCLGLALVGAVADDLTSGHWRVTSHAEGVTSLAHAPEGEYRQVDLFDQRLEALPAERLCVRMTRRRRHGREHDEISADRRGSGELVGVVTGSRQPGSLTHRP